MCRDIEDIPYNTQQKEKVAFKLNYESRYAFTTCCQKEQITPKGLKAYLKPSIGNHSE